MNDRTAGAILLVIGVVAIFAAIVGGGIKIQQIEVGSVQSKWRQWLLAAFGLVISLTGMVMALGDDKPSDATGTENAVASGDETTDANAGDAAGDANAPDANVAVEENAPDSNAVDENAVSDNATTEAQ
jgi:hypothetical protein